MFKLFAHRGSTERAACRVGSGAAALLWPPQTPRGLKQMASVRFKLSTRSELQTGVHQSWAVFLILEREHGKEGGGEQAHPWSGKARGLGDVPGTDPKECVCVWEKGPSF